MRRYTNLSLLKYLKRPHVSKKTTVDKTYGRCSVCGEVGEWRFMHIINDDLAREWQIDNQTRLSFDRRESMFCRECKCSFRLRQLAEAINYTFGGSDNLISTIAKENFRKLRIAEINSCGTLHEILKNLPIYYSEYGSEDPAIPNQSLEKLTYNDQDFDLVLTSDTLEHVPDADRALSEIRRILKPGGYHIFTTPVVWYKKTKQKASLDKGRVIHHAPPSFHGEGQPDYIVFNEFGYDIIDRIKSRGFEVYCYGVNIFDTTDVSGVFITKRKERE